MVQRVNFEQICQLLCPVTVGAFLDVEWISVFKKTKPKVTILTNGAALLTDPYLLVAPMPHGLLDPWGCPASKPM